MGTAAAESAVPRTPSPCTSRRHTFTPWRPSGWSACRTSRDASTRRRKRWTRYAGVEGGFEGRRWMRTRYLWKQERCCALCHHTSSRHTIRDLFSPSGTRSTRSVRIITSDKPNGEGTNSLILISDRMVAWSRTRQTKALVVCDTSTS